MNYAVVKIGGKQYKVSEGDIIEVQRLPEGTNDKVIFEEVLLAVSDKDIKVGKPTLKGKVTGKIIENKKGEKIRVAKFKSKVRYRRVTGFRPQITLVRIEKIEI
ncbi:MAG: 50S ribosomal protein L21 [Patescibacteria group bacterium]